MALTVSEVASGVRQLATFGSPPSEPTEEQLSGAAILTTLNDFETALTVEAGLSQQNQLLQKVSLGMPGVRDIALPCPNLFGLVQVEVQVDQQYDSWERIPIINKTELDSAEQEGTLACGMYGTPPRLTFNFIPSLQLVGFYTLRAWFETVAGDQQPQETPRLNPNFHNLWKYEAAIICREIYLDLPRKPALIETRDVFRTQYYEWAHKSPDQVAEPKPAAYGTENIDEMYRPWNTGGY